MEKGNEEGKEGRGRGKRERGQREGGMVKGKRGGIIGKGEG